MRALTKKAFTLVELLVVIAITAILMTLILVPIIQSFNLTRAAQAFSDAQDRARTLTEKIAREIGNGTLVRNTSGNLGALSVVVPAKPGSSSTVPGYDTTRPLIRVTLKNVKLDIYKAAEGEPDSTLPAGTFRNPYTGMIDPTQKAPRGQVNLPVGPGMTMVRYFIGLNDPFRTGTGTTLLAGYDNPYDGMLMARSGGRDNLFVLYRAEVQPLVWSTAAGKFVTNKKFFYDLDRDNDPNTSGPLFDDPTFFDPTVAYAAYTISDPDGTAEPTKAQMVQNWLDAATVQTEVTRFDMIQPVYDKYSHQVVYQGNAPELMPLIQFRPAHVASEPAEGKMASRLGQEGENPIDPATQLHAFTPDTYLTHAAGLANSLVRTIPQGFDQNLAANNAYEVGLAIDSPNPSTDPLGFSIYAFDPDSGFDDAQVGSVVGGNRVGTELFDTYYYLDSFRTNTRFAFSRAVAAANSRSNWTTTRAYRDAFNPYFLDSARGRIRGSFAISDFGAVASGAPFNPTSAIDPNNPNNLPLAFTWPDGTPPLSPLNDNTTAGVFSDAQYSTINRKFNKVWNDHPELRPSIHRFVDLRVTPNGDGTPSPLNPDPMVGFSRSHIVPGSEDIKGPDQNPGPNYGHLIRYTRTTRNPGPNQYRINYVDLPEPVNPTTGAVDYTQIGVSAADQATFAGLTGYSPTNFVSAVIQPRYKAGYIQFNSDPNVPLPNNYSGASPGAGRFEISYRVQFNKPKDSFTVDYDSRQEINVLLTIRNYPASSIPNPETVTLKATAKVRNFLR